MMIIIITTFIMRKHTKTEEREGFIKEEVSTKVADTQRKLLSALFREEAYEGISK